MYRYSISGTGYTGPATIDANDLRVYGYGGDDVITLVTCHDALVSGNTGSDDITLDQCVDCDIIPLSDSDLEAGLTDIADIYRLIDDTGSRARAGGGGDTFIFRGLCFGSILDGEEGDDRFGGNGNLTWGYLYGADGMDSVIANGDWGGTLVEGNDEADDIDCSSAWGSIRIRGGGGSDVLKGGSGNDDIIGGWGQDVIYANGGNDVIDGRDEFGPEVDIIFGGADNDTALTFGEDELFEVENVQ